MPSATAADGSRSVQEGVCPMNVQARRELQRRADSLPATNRIQIVGDQLKRARWVIQVSCDYPHTPAATKPIQFGADTHADPPPSNGRSHHRPAEIKSRRIVEKRLTCAVMHQSSPSSRCRRMATSASNGRMCSIRSGGRAIAAA